MKKSLNRESLERYGEIDRLLRTKNKFVTLDMLVEAVSSRIGRPVGKRTIQLDIEDMRFNQQLKLEAPIIVNRLDKKFYYAYSDPNYSITSKLIALYMPKGIAIIEVEGVKLGDAISGLLEEVYMQRAMADIDDDHRRINPVNLKATLVKASDALDELEQDSDTLPAYVETIRETAAMLLRELERLDHNESIEEIKA